MGKRSKKEARAGAPKLGIAAMKIPGKVTNIAISDITPSLISEVDIPDAVVAYLDILGFSNKSGDADITTSLADFSGPLAIAATEYDQVYFNVFSDCAFAAAAVDHADEILAVLRFAFGQWASDGILVRGGIALGTYKETYSHALTLALLQAQRTFTGKLFAGSGVTAAVRLEGQGAGALLFTSDDCGKLYAAKFGEPVFTLGEQKLLGWSDDENDLFWFLGISLLRLFRLLASENASDDVARKFRNNILYVLSASDSLLLRCLVLSLLSLPALEPNIRATVIDWLRLNDPDDFTAFQSAIEALLKKDEIRLMQTLAGYDSSIPGWIDMPGLTS